MTAYHVIALTTAPTYGADLERRDEIRLIDGVGIEGDRHAGKLRQVTIVCTGELAEAATELGVDRIDGVATRRNIVVDAPSLPRTHGARITIGSTELAVWRDCAPCELMNELIGEDARQAMRWRAGISATVIRGGIVRVGDAIAC